MVKYELVVVLDTNRPDDQITASVEKTEELIKKNGGTIDSRDAWGKRRLAYPINRRREGYYALIQFTAEPTSEVLSELRRHLRISEDVLRSLVTKAVVGKSRGTPPADDSFFESRGHRGGGRDREHGGRGRYDRGDRGGRDRGDRGDRGPRDSAPREAAPAPAPEASA